MGAYFSHAMKRYNHLIGEINGVYHDMSVKLGLAGSVMNILYTIRESGDACLLRDICRRSGLVKQTVNSALRKLEADGVIYLEAADAKSKNVCLTEAGKALTDQTAGRVIQAENEIFAAWPAEDVEKYLALTERFLADIRKKAEIL